MQEMLELAGVLGTIASVGLFIFFGVRVVNIYSDRLERRGGSSPDVLNELEDLQARVQQLEAGHERLAEVEERIDFAERLLTSQAIPAPPHEEPRS